VERIGYIEETKNGYKFFICKFQGKRPCGRARHRWEDMMIRKVNREAARWIEMAQDMVQW
jgi:hypothetical protein